MLTCYIASLATTTPFRISIHSWFSPERPSALIQKRTTDNQKAVYMVQVVIDGIKLL